MTLEIIMRDGQPPSEAPGKPLLTGPEPRTERIDGLEISRNVPVAMRDGVRILIDVYRPADRAAGVQLPVILGWSPYGKHYTRDSLVWPEAGVQPGWISRHTGFEAPDPAYWCAHGYAVAYADPRGTWLSEGEMSHGGPQESEDCHDLIEWLGSRPWSNGRVGLSGVSYLACIQWQVGPLRPPHLAALNPWEGFSDWYREFARHGGIPETGFFPYASGGVNWSTTRTEDAAANARAHPLYDEYWASKETAIEEIVAPIFIVASWSDQGFHTRGTLEAYRRVGSRHKWLEIHGAKKWAHYYDPRNVERLRTFFDHFLREADDAVLGWPKVRLEVRERAGAGTLREEAEWPPARTRHEPLFLDLAAQTLVSGPPSAPAAVEYDTASGRLELDHVFTRDTELTGHAKLRLWVEAVDCEDADLFVGLEKLGVDGEPVGFTFYAVYDDGPAALGWLRLSHRELDSSRSRPEQPVHPHTREQPLEPGIAEPVEIEVWPSSIHFAPGEALRLIVTGSDIYVSRAPGSPRCLHEQTRNDGRLLLHAGGEYDSHLLVPVVEPA